MNIRAFCLTVPFKNMPEIYSTIYEIKPLSSFPKIKFLKRIAKNATNLQN